MPVAVSSAAERGRLHGPTHFFRDGFCLNPRQSRPVEPRQVSAGADPQIPIGRSRGADHEVVRQAVR
jgi:hypothetical protein